MVLEDEALVTTTIDLEIEEQVVVEEQEVVALVAEEEAVEEDVVVEVESQFPKINSMLISMLTRIRYLLQM